MNSGTLSQPVRPGFGLLTDRDWRARALSTRLAVTRDDPARDLTFNVPDGQVVITITEPLPQTMHHAILKIVDAMKLPDNWDGYGAKSVDSLAAGAALNVLLNVLPRDIPTPSIVPTPKGGIQLEWHCNSVDLEIEAMPDEHLSVWFSDLLTGDDAEELLRDNFQPLARFFDRLTK